MKVIFFTKYTRKGASSRLRTFQYLDYFEQNGINCTVSPFFDDVYLAQVYRNKTHNKLLAFRSFIRRVFMLVTVLKYDKVVIEKELFPYFPSVFELLLKLFGVRYIADYDDAIFHNYDISTNPLIRFFLKNKIRNVMRYAGMVVAGNEYLKQKAEEFGAREITIIPTVIDVNKYTPRSYEGQTPFTIGWIGSPITFKYLYSLKSIFENLASKYSIRIRYIGSNKTLGLSVEEIVPWNEDEEASQIKTFNLGIMPLEDNIWERGKCGYKLIQYMGCAVPVIGTPIGVNNIIIQNGINGFKANTEQDWQNHIEYFIKNSLEENKKIGLNGRALIEQNYSLQVYQEVWLKVLKTKMK
jgi:glycosyltransferase involved in cell wall biosynthesis